MDMIRDALIQLASENWHLIALAILGIAAVGTLLGSLKTLAASLLKASIRGGDWMTTVIVSKKGLRVSVPLALGLTLFGSGWLLGASKPARVEYVTSPPEVVTRDVVKEVVREVKVPTFIEKIIEVPMKIVQPPANAKCRYCAALLNVDGVPEAPPPGTPFASPDRSRFFRCGGCDGILEYKEARIRFRFKRNEPLWTIEPRAGEDVDTYTAVPVGRDPIPEPVPPAADAAENARQKYREAVEMWKKQCGRFIERS